MSITVTVTDMSCDGCEDIVEDAVSEVSGVESVSADRDAESVTVEGDPDVDEILDAIDFAGYTASLGDEPEDDEETVEETADDDPGEAADDAA
ncbi:MAG: heavy-metal-associated domain-containing protein [Halanaeroarchaeum sp.]